MTLTLCLISVVSFAQKEIGTYHNDLFQKEYSVECDESGKYYIQISGETESRKCFFIVENENIDAFRQSLNDVKNKYVEWCNVAKENKITTMYKYMDIKFKSGIFMWLGTEWYGNYATPKPGFLISKTGKYLCLLFSGNEIKDISNQYITEKAFWVFSSVEEIEELQNLLSEKTLQEFQNESNKANDLFK